MNCASRGFACFCTGFLLISPTHLLVHESIAVAARRSRDTRRHRGRRWSTAADAGNDDDDDNDDDIEDNTIMMCRRCVCVRA